MATTFARTSTIARDVATMPELLETIRWFNDLLPATAKAELQDAQAGGSLLDPVSFVDGKRNPNVDSVKPFGVISYVDALGPMRQAIAAADTFVRTYAPRETGFYEGALRWFRSARGGPRAVSGLPNADNLLPTSNVQLVDLAPYASTLEIEVPRGVIYGAYALLNRMFGGQLSISFTYGAPAEFGGLIEKPGNPAARPYAVPVLTIGGPASSVRDGARPRPANARGTRRRRRGQ